MSKELLAAAKSGDIEKVRELLNKGADVNVRMDGLYGETPLQTAAYAGHTETAALLKAHGGVK